MKYILIAYKINGFTRDLKLLEINDDKFYLEYLIKSDKKYIELKKENYKLEIYERIK